MKYSRASIVVKARKRTSKPMNIMIISYWYVILR